MKLLELAHSPPVIVSPDTSVMDAIHRSLPARIGAVIVMEGDATVGILTARDIMLKVVHRRLDQDRTQVRQVMTSPVLMVLPDSPPEEVIRLMLDRNILHLPLSFDGHKVEGVLTLRSLLKYLMDDLRQDLRFMKDYVVGTPPLLQS